MMVAKWDPASSGRCEGGLTLAEDSDTSILTADDHPLVRGALREAVAGIVEGADVLEAGTFEEVTGHLGRGSDVDLVLSTSPCPGRRVFRASCTCAHSTRARP